MISRYKRVLEELRNKTGKLASEYITQLYFILRNEEGLSAEDCRTRIEHDCSDIWTEDTIRKYLPLETKSATKRKAGKISAEVKKKRQRKEPKLLAVIATDTSQCSEVLDNDRDISDKIDNSVGINLTENSSVGEKKQESKTFQEIIDSQDSAYVWTKDFNSYLIANRQEDEVRELLEDLSLDECIDECLSKILFLPSRLAEQIYLDVNEARTSGIISDFELIHDGTRVISVRKPGRDEKEYRTWKEFASEISADTSCDNAAATADSRGINKSREEQSADTTAVNDSQCHKVSNDEKDGNDDYRSKYLDNHDSRR